MRELRRVELFQVGDIHDGTRRKVFEPGHRQVLQIIGDFNVIKYDVDAWEQTTQTIGRGSYAIGGYSILNIDSDVTNVADKAGFYCIEGEADGIPTYADSTNCESYEDAVPWLARAFPFTPTPEIESVFEDKTFFEADDTDLIDDNGDNFTIPTYVTS